MPVRGAVLRMIASRNVVIAISALAMVVQARLLEPADFGIYAIALAALMLIETSAGFGIRHYIVRSERIDPDLLGAGLGLGFAIAAGLAVLTAVLALGPLGARMPEGLAACLLLLVPTILLLPVENLALARMARRMDFGLVALLQVLRTVLNAAVAIGLAIAGAGPLALVAGLAAERVMATVILVWANPKDDAGHGFVAPHPHGWGRFIRFGLEQSGAAILPRAVDLGLASIIPAAFGPAALGLYNRAVTVTGLLDKTVVEGLTPVVLPALADGLRRGKTAGEMYLAKISRLTVLLWPGFAVLAIEADAVVRLVLGPDWLQVVPLVQLLCLIGLFQPFTAMSMHFFAAVGLMSTYFRIQTVQQLVRLSLVLAGAMVSLEAVILGLVLAKAVKVVQVEFHLHKALGAGRRTDMGRIVANAAAVTLLTVSGPLALARGLPDLPISASLPVSLLLAGAGWLAGIAVCRHSLGGDLRAVAISGFDRMRLRRAS